MFNMVSKFGENGNHAKHLRTFMHEYPKAKRAFVVARNDHSIQLEKAIQAIPWDKFLFEKLDSLT
jgi:hypothetical protein